MQSAEFHRSILAKSAQKSENPLFSTVEICAK